MPGNESPYFRIQEIGDGIWAALAKPGSGAWSNAGIVHLGDSALVIDAMYTPAAGAALREAAERLTKKSVRWLVLTHRDYDHVLGAQAFSGATVVATGVTAQSIQRRVPEYVAAVRADGGEYVASLEAEAREQDDSHERLQRLAVVSEHRALLQDVDRLAPLYPNMAIGDELTIHGSGRQAQVLSFGGVHTESDSVVFLPEARVLFCGDIVQIGYHPAVRHGTPQDWPAVMRPIADLEADVVVSGHGPVGSREDVLLAERYYYELPEWAAGHPVPEPFASWDASQTLVANLRYAAGPVR